MWLHPAENSRFGARHIKLIHKFVEVVHPPFPMSHVPLTTGNWFVLLNLSESGKEVSTCFS